MLSKGEGGGGGGGWGKPDKEMGAGAKVGEETERGRVPL